MRRRPRRSRSPRSVVVHHVCVHHVCVHHVCVHCCPLAWFAPNASFCAGKQTVTQSMPSSALQAQPVVDRFAKKWGPLVFAFDTAAVIGRQGHFCACVRARYTVLTQTRHLAFIVHWGWSLCAFVFSQISRRAWSRGSSALWPQHQSSGTLSAQRKRRSQQARKQAGNGTNLQRLRRAPCAALL